MEKFRKVLEEINDTMNKFVVFHELLTAICIFLGFYLFFTFIVIDFINPSFAVIPAGVYLGVESFHRMKKSKLKEVEQKYNFLNEKLRTASDNINANNEIVNNLQHEIVHDLKKVKSSSFLNMKETSLKVGLIVLFCFMILFLNTFHLKGLHINIQDYVGSDDIQLLDDDAEANTYSGLLGGVGDAPEDDIFGLENVAKLGDDELTLGILSQGYEINVRDVKEVTKRQYDELFPSEVVALSATTFEEDIPREQQELVSNYFKDLAKS